ncbi:MAG TPA: cation:proton antiporter [Paucimonas sp.]|nr:cation:proton antiporter [Paucimonas sp.]
MRLRQPAIVAFILVGIALGPSVLDWVRGHEEVDLLAQIGATVLLFVVGLKIAQHLHETYRDGIIMGTRGMEPVPTLMTGSVATRLVHLADVPVTLVKSGYC